MQTDPILARLVDQVQTARTAKATLVIQGGGSKAFTASRCRVSPWTSSPWRASACTSRANWWSRCAPALRWPSWKPRSPRRVQCLPFEPPHFDAGGTVGGKVAAGLAGPARATVGGVRDYVLGATLLNGKAQVLSFGGQVMKNVAGYKG